MLFDGNGRRNARGLQSAVIDPEPDFYLDQPVIDLKQRLTRLVEFFPVRTKFAPATEFVERIQALIALIGNDPEIGSALKAPHFPICLPQIGGGDYGETLDKLFAEAVGASYSQQFRRRHFENRRKGTLTRQVTVVGKNHGELIALMLKGPVVGILTVPLQGFSVQAQREQMSAMPGIVSLGGGYDIATAIAAYPETLSQGCHTPGLTLSSLQFQSPEGVLSFRADDDVLFFGGGPSGTAVASDSGGLFFRG
jgi:hypothetical protein